MGRRETNEILVEMYLRVSSRTAVCLLTLSTSVLSETLQPEPVHNYPHSEGKKSHTHLEPPLFRVEAVVSNSLTKAACLPCSLLCSLGGSHWLCPKLLLLQSERGHVPHPPLAHPLLQPHDSLGIWQVFRF